MNRVVTVEVDSSAARLGANTEDASDTDCSAVGRDETKRVPALDTFQKMRREIHEGGEAIRAVGTGSNEPRSHGFLFRKALVHYFFFLIETSVPRCCVFTGLDFLPYPSLSQIDSII